MLKWKIFRYKAVAIAWFLIMCVLFFLPGSAFPESDWMGKIDFDKIIHVGLFSVLLFLWRSSFNLNRPNYGWALLGAAVIYGFTVEVIQLYWIPNRSFDLFDVLADSIGSALGLLIWSRVYKK